MDDMFKYEDFGTVEGVLNFIKEKSDDIDRVYVYPRGMNLYIKDDTGKMISLDEGNVGMVLQLVKGCIMLKHTQAQAVMEDGIIGRLNLPVEVHA